MTTAELAARIKAKYPDYAKLDDADLVNRITAKYPEYKAQLDEPAAAPTPARFDPSAVAAGPGAIPSTVDVSEAAPTTLAIGAAPFMGMGGAAAAPAALRAAVSPIGMGITQTATDLYRGKSLPDALYSGARSGIGAALGGKLPGGNTLMNKIYGLILARTTGGAP